MLSPLRLYNNNNNNNEFSILTATTYDNWYSVEGEFLKHQVRAVYRECFPFII
jgi:hypothetical protein